MKYNFDKLANRKNTNSLKYDDYECDLPMWVADMDFETPFEIKEVLKKRVEIGAYGYSIFDDSFFESVSNFFLRRHHVKFDKNNMIFTTGVVPAISSMVRRLTSPGEKVLIMSPVYNIFYNSILNNGRKVISSDLVYENSNYHIDFGDLDKKLSDNLVNLMIFCNPHNPIGKIWSKEEIKKVGELAKKHNVVVISDEIHCDIVTPNKSYNSFYCVDENRNNSIVCVSGSKCFNLAGLQGACIICDNKYLRDKIDRGFNNDEIAEPNFFVIEAYKEGFNNCEEYLNEVNSYIYENKLRLARFFAKNMPNLKYKVEDATYLAWIDVSYYDIDASKITSYLLKNYSLRITSGEEYGKNGKSFVRVNLATSHENVEKFLKIFEEGLNKYINKR